MTEITDPTARLQARYDADPDALTWARTRIRFYVDRVAAFEKRANAEGHTDYASGLGIARQMAEQLLLGEGCVIGAFDARLPVIAGAATTAQANALEEQQR